MFVFIWHRWTRRVVRVGALNGAVDAPHLPPKHGRAPRGNTICPFVVPLCRSPKTNLLRPGKDGQLCLACPGENMKPVWILVLVVSALSFIEAQRSLVSLSDVITLMSFIDPNWGEKDFHFQICIFFFIVKLFWNFIPWWLRMVRYHL